MMYDVISIDALLWSVRFPMLAFSVSSSENLKLNCSAKSFDVELSELRNVKDETGSFKKGAFRLSLTMSWLNGVRVERFPGKLKTLVVTLL